MAKNKTFLFKITMIWYPDVFIDILPYKSGMPTNYLKMKLTVVWALHNLHILIIHHAESHQTETMYFSPNWDSVL